MTTTKKGTSTTLARVGAVAALALTSVAGLATAGQAATATGPAAITPSSPNGSAAGGQTITLTIPSTATKKFVSGKVGIQFQLSSASAVAKATCSSAPDTGSTTVTVSTAANIRYLSTTKVSTVVPALSGTGGVYLICAYDAAYTGSAIPTTAGLVGRGQYIVSTAPAVPTFTPASGPALGGQTITVTVSTGLPTAITASTPLTATLGGLPLTNIQLVDSTTFTAVTPPKAASTGNVLSVSTLGGSKSSSTTYTYANGVIVSPNTAPTNSSVDLYIQGVGFSGLSFDATATAGVDTAAGTAVTGVLGTNNEGAHVYLIRPTTSGGGYDPSGRSGSANKANGQVAECVKPVVISDTELICTLDTSSSVTAASGAYTYSTTDLANGVYSVTVVSDGAALTAPSFTSVISSGSTFTVAPF